MQYKKGLLFMLISLPFWLVAQDVEFKALRKLNSPYRETNLSVTPNGKYIFFMSGRGGQVWSTPGYPDLHGSSKEFDGDIWYSVQENGEWQYPKVLARPINTSEGEDEPSISMDGQTVYYQSWRNDWYASGGPYYQAELEGKEWKEPKGLGGNITVFFLNLAERYNQAVRESTSWMDMLMGKRKELSYGTDGMAVSPDGKIFVVSVTNYDKDGMNMDLFISRKNNKGEWSYPEKLPVNTSSNEISAFIAGDNRTLYFASDRRPGFGGYDIYKTTLLGGNACSRAENIGVPYNTGLDDYGFIVNSVGELGYMVRNGDIYEFRLTEEVQPEKTLVVNGTVKDEAGKALPARIHVNGNRQAIADVKSNSYSGEYSFSTAWEAGVYDATATTADGRSKTVRFEVNAQTSSPLQVDIVLPVLVEKPKEEVAVVTPPEPVEPIATPKVEAKSETGVVERLSDHTLTAGSIIQVEKLYFTADASEIQPNSFAILDEIVAVLSRRPDVQIEIGGHTNNLPPSDYCDRLSTARAKAVYDYLINKGIAKERLSYKGYGKRKPIESNDTEDGRKKNQRVEFTVLQVD